MRKVMAMAFCGILSFSLLALGGCAGQSPSQSSSEKAESLVAHDMAAPESEEQSDASSEEDSADGAWSEAAPTEEAASEPVASSEAKAMIPGFTALSQYPELPNGCEVTTLAAVLNYDGVPVDKTTLSDDYLPKAPVGQANFYQEFVGNPRNSDAYGCYAPVITSTANAYLASVGSPLRAQNLTGTAFEQLYSYIDNGQPVIVWATQYNQQGHYSVTWYVDGQVLTWFTPEHCMALVGYDKDAGLVYVADPMQGDIVSFDLATFISNYNDLGQQAVVIS